MAVIGNSPPAPTDDAWVHVIVSPTAAASIRQLRDDEQKAVYTAVGTINAHGLSDANGVKASEIDPSEHAYYVRIAAAPNVRLITRRLNASMIEVLDVVRPQTIANLFHAS